MQSPSVFCYKNGNYKYGSFYNTLNPQLSGTEPGCNMGLRRGHACYNKLLLFQMLLPPPPTSSMWLCHLLTTLLFSLLLGVNSTALDSVGHSRYFSSYSSYSALQTHRMLGQHNCMHHVHERNCSSVDFPCSVEP
jgi:hypothetical protein